MKRQKCGLPINVDQILDRLSEKRGTFIEKRNYIEIIVNNERHIKRGKRLGNLKLNHSLVLTRESEKRTYLRIFGKCGTKEYNLSEHLPQ